MVINSRQTPLTDTISALNEHDLAVHMALVDQQQFAKWRPNGQYHDMSLGMTVIRTPSQQ